MDRSAVCPQSVTLGHNLAGFEFKAVHIDAGLHTFRPHVACFPLQENVCALIARGVSCRGSKLHIADPHRKIPLTVTGFVPDSSAAYECRPPKYTGLEVSPKGRCCYIGHPFYIGNEGACYTSGNQS
jgi:hypothetical protein